MLITTLYLKLYFDYLLSTNGDFEVSWGMAELINLLGCGSTTEKIVVEIIFIFLHSSLSMCYRSASQPL